MRLVHALLASSLLAAPSVARADPQASVGLTTGAALRGDALAGVRSVDFHLGVRGDLLFVRRGPRDFGLGPYATFATHGFDEVSWGGGLGVLFPVTEITPLVLGGGGYGRWHERLGFEGGVAASVMFGARSYNFHSAYELSGGLLVEGRMGFGLVEERSIVIALQLDVVVLAMPFILLANARGSKETRPVR